MEKQYSEFRKLSLPDMWEAEFYCANLLESEWDESKWMDYCEMARSAIIEFGLLVINVNGPMNGIMIAGPTNDDKPFFIPEICLDMNKNEMKVFIVVES